jgi:hypothetical protein
MRSFFWRSLALTIMILVLSSCNSKLPDDLPDIGVDVKPPNQIAFARDYGAQMFIYDEGKWIKIENDIDYGETITETIIVPVEGYLPNNGTADLAPYYPNLTKSMDMRVILIGRIVRDGKVTDEKTAGYIDVILEP